MLRPAEQGGPQDQLLLDQAGQVSEREPVDPVPQAEVGQLGILPLQTDELLHDGQRRLPDPGEQELPGRGGPAQRPR
jgi:hypothetical protein